MHQDVLGNSQDWNNTLSPTNSTKMIFRLSPPWNHPGVIISIVVAIVVISILLVAIASCMYLLTRKCKANHWEKLKEKDEEEKVSLLESKPLTANHKPSYKNIISYLETLKGQKYSRVPSIEEKKVSFVIPPLLTTKRTLQTECAKADRCYICRNNNNNKKDPLNKQLSSSSESVDVKMYHKRRGSTDVLDGKADHEGKICFSVKYDRVNEYLTVNVLKAAYLRPHGLKETADAYIAVEVSNGTKTDRRLTKVIRGTRNPEFNESFAFHVRPEDVGVKTLTLTACDYDRFSRKVPIGNVTLPLEEVDNITNDEDGNDREEVWYDLEKQVQGKSYQGELMVSLCHMPEQGLIKVVIMRAKALRLKHPHDTSYSIYAKASVLYKDRVVASKNTRMNHDHICPMFDEELDFRYDQKKRLPDTYIVMTLCTKTTFGVRRLIGKTVIGPREYATGPGYNHWTDMMAAPYSIVAQWHVLR